MYVPSRDEFRQKATEGNLIPVYREILADRLTPVSAYEKIAQDSQAFLLESVEGGETLGRYSFLGANPFLIFRSKGNIATIEEGSKTRTAVLAPGDDPLTVLEELMSHFQYVPVDGAPSFCGGAVGYLSYDMVRYFEKLPETANDDLNIDDCYFIFTDTILCFDHVKHSLKILCNARVDKIPDKVYDEAVARIEAIVAQLRTPVTYEKSSQIDGPVEVKHNMSQSRYEAAVDKCKDYIMAGDAFQVVPSQRFTVPLKTKPFQVYRALRSVNPSPYMYYLNLGENHVVGSSPEILVTCEGGRVTVRPIAGTRPRGNTTAEDSALALDLLADEKERCEHVMLIDLGRSDVGRVSEYGSVQVDEFMVIEKYSHVMHIVSNVHGKLADDKTVYDAMRACFPAGTLTGAPKVRAMEIIEELEPTRRGLYGGAVGYFSFNGDMDFAIAIRTMWVEGKTAYIQAGAGVVADSVPEMEYQETLNKSRALMVAIELAQKGLD